MFVDNGGDFAGCANKGKVEIASCAGHGIKEWERKIDKRRSNKRMGKTKE